MSYRVSQQSDGLYTIHDMSIFATAKKGSVDFDNSWMDTAVKNAQIQEKFGYRPPVFIKHNSFDQLDSTRKEDAVGLVANMRRKKVRCEGKLIEGVIADLVGLDEDTAERIQKNRLNGRSIEAIQPKSRRSIDGLALLGRTKPFFPLAQGSEPVDENTSFSLDDSYILNFNLDDESTENFNMIPPQGGAPGAPAPAPQAPPAPAPGGADPALAQAFQLIAKALGLAGGGAPAPQAPQAQPPQAPPAAARMQLSEEAAARAKLEAQNNFLKEQISNLSSKTADTQAAFQDATADADAARKEAELVSLFAELDKSDRVYGEQHVRDTVARFGVETYREMFLPFLQRAPVGTPPKATAPGAVAPQNTVFSEDADLKNYVAASPEVQGFALAGAKEYDAEAAKSQFFANSTPRAAFIAAEVKEAQKANR